MDTDFVRTTINVAEYLYKGDVGGMSGFMNVVLLYGNGFDRALGLETSYDDFRHWLSDARNANRGLTPEVSEFLHMVRSHKGSPLWSDFESAIGLCCFEGMTSCQGFSTRDYAVNTVFALQDLMRAFLRDASEKSRQWVISDVMREMFISSFYRLCSENGFELDSSSHKMQIVSLNYTNTLETILGEDVVFHPHGVLSSGGLLVFGVDSARQLSVKCGEFARLLFKRGQIEENTIQGETSDQKLMRMISVADVVILFGLSFGPSDYRIWRALGRESYSRGLKIVLCPFGNDTLARFERGVSQWGLRENEVDIGQKLLWKEMSANVVIAKDSKGDYLGLKAVRAALENGMPVCG